MTESQKWEEQKKMVKCTFCGAKSDEESSPQRFFVTAGSIKKPRKTAICSECITTCCIIWVGERGRNAK
jgi:hypothetical protein